MSVWQEFREWCRAIRRQREDKRRGRAILTSIGCKCKPGPLRRLARWAWQYAPVTRKRLKAEVDAEKSKAGHRLAKLKQEHARELLEAGKKAEEVVSKLVDLQFRKDGGRCYMLTVAFDPSLVIAFNSRDDLRYVAEHVGRQVEDEIASTRFIKSAHEPALRRHAYNPFEPENN